MSGIMPGILKTDRLGYDGKGQHHVNTVAELQVAFNECNCDCVLEKRANLLYEISVVVARNQTGVRVSPAVTNEHENGILVRSLWRKDGINHEMENRAQECAVKMAESLDMYGVLAVEFFVTSEGLLFNEMAPRPHNSFHASIEAAYTSQFEQHIRAVCGLPFGNSSFHTSFEMKNLLGNIPEDDLEKYLKDPYARLHLYGKNEERPGRKLGHVTRLYP